MCIASALAAGDDDTAPPPTTPTSQCPSGQIYDKKIKKCRPASYSGFTEDERFFAVRELAYSGRFASAELVLSTMKDHEASRVLTYIGFLQRKQGHVHQAIETYERAISVDPNNLLVRSYLGQGFVELNQRALASEQLDEIKRRSGEGTWAEKSLSSAIDRGYGYSY